MAAPTLLLVEDDVLLQEVITNQLVDSGFEVVVAEDGNRAIAELEEDASRFKAVVTDIRLSEGPNGWAVGRRARTIVSNMPVIYITGDSAHERSSKGVPEGVLLAKPFRLVRLTTAAATLIMAEDTRRRSHE
jgi:DNA-binding response OmpR family regulator